MVIVPRARNSFQRPRSMERVLKMLKFWARNSILPGVVLICAGLLLAGRAHSQSASSGSPPGLSFASKTAAEELLTRTLPAATAGNPKYRAADKSDVTTQWLTKKISFRGSGTGGVAVSMSEEIVEFKNGVRGSVGSHEAEFSLEDIRISERKDSTDIAENGERARGIIFNCIVGNCIKAKWGGNPSTSAWTDIYLQDDALRANILAAFEALKQRP
jgi:hypothetical protein